MLQTWVLLTISQNACKLTSFELESASTPNNKPVWTHANQTCAPDLGQMTAYNNHYYRALLRVVNVGLLFLHNRPLLGTPL